MKLMVCGKGGCGKSTVASLLAKQYAHTGKRVVVVDAEVSTVLGPHHLLGTGIPSDLIGYFNGEDMVRKRMKSLRQVNSQPQSPLFGTWTYESIPPDFCREKEGIKLVTIGKIRDTSVACKSPWMALAREFILGLSLAENDRAVIDAEAGVEHFGRGIDAACDAVLLVIDPSHESVCLAERVSGMAEAVNVPLYFVLNKTNANTSQFLRKVIPAKNRILGEFPLDPDLLRAGAEGRALPGGYPAAAQVLESLAELQGACGPIGVKNR
ncbi:MAG: P-loop NTPase [Methanomicrobiales archaeon]|nr:P-loop NTPase [Methanomicrobiales archaeon]